MTSPTAASTATDHGLIARAQRGDQQAYGDLVCRYHGSVVNVVYRLCGDPQLAEEAAQEAFIRAWQHLDSYKPQHAFRNWLYRIAINAALDALRRTPVCADVDDLPLQAPEDDPETQTENRQRASAVRQAVLELPEASRAVLVLREYEGLSYQEISQALNIPLGTVMSRLNYARSLLRQRLAAQLEAL